MELTTDEISELKQTALRIREHIIRMSGNGGCFTGASLSCADLLLYLYSIKINLNTNNLNDPERDYLFLSKGHDVPALYGTFAELGIIDNRRLHDHLKTNDNIYWHPNSLVDGVEFHSGSLGHLLSVAMGVAYDIRIRKQTNKVYVVLGDGELNEGSIWEGLLVASAFKLDNLVIIIDRNQFQANVETENLIPLEPLEEKFKAFGMAVKKSDGHDFDNMNQVFRNLPFETGKPSVVIADTIRGKGLPSIEKRADRWFCNFTAEEIDSLLIELRGGSQTELVSESLIVR